MSQLGQCAFVKEDGERCKAVPQTDSEYCYFHDPALAEERLEASAKGGRNRRSPALGPLAPEVMVREPEDVLKLYAETINQVRQGKLDPRTANAIGYLGQGATRALEQIELAKRLEELKRLVTGRFGKQPAKARRTK